MSCWPTGTAEQKRSLAFCIATSYGLSALTDGVTKTSYGKGESDALHSVSNFAIRCCLIIVVSQSRVAVGH